MRYTIHKANKNIKGRIELDGSKSISNRILIIRALSGKSFSIDHLSTSNDTTTLDRLLQDAQDGASLDAGAAGTTFRFLTAYLSLQPGTQILTGSDRMKQRPIGVLVEAMRQLGAQIDYLENEGYPPLKIQAPAAIQNTKLQIAASVSSQYISALLMIAPTLPQGLELELTGTIVSRPYIEMTLQLMQSFGVKHEWKGQTIHIAPQTYQARDCRVEADWSAASYYYAVAAFSDELDLRLEGLDEESLQGDSVVAEIMEQFGIQSQFSDGGVHLQKAGEVTQMFEWDFIKCPDIAQTLAVICAGLGVQGLFSGLETLKIKETDRITALQNELGKVQSWFSKLPARFSTKSDKEYYMIEGKSIVEAPVFATYEDHRMAMAFAPLAILGKITIEEPMVVAKSYPRFYEDLESLGFEVERG